MKERLQIIKMPNRLSRIWKDPYRIAVNWSTHDCLDNKTGEVVHTKNHQSQDDVDSGRLSDLLAPADGENTHRARNRAGPVHTGLHRGPYILILPADELHKYTVIQPAGKLYKYQSINYIVKFLGI